MAAPRGTKKPSLGATFRPAADESKKLGTTFREGPRASIPPVVVVHPLGLLRDVFTRYGWPETVADVNDAHDKAVAAGALDVSLVAAVYGVGEWQRAKFVLLPAVEGEEDGPGVFRVIREGDVVRIVPPAR